MWGVLMWSMRVLVTVLAATFTVVWLVKKGVSLPSAPLVMSVRSLAASAFMYSVAPLLSHGPVPCLLRSRVVSKAQLASMPMTVLVVM